MPAQVDVWWREKVRSLTENQRLSANRIYEKFKREAKEGENYPSARWIANCQAEYRDLPESIRRLYRELHWPETFTSEALPWECAEMAFQVVEIEFRGPPLIRNLLWCWRITQAKPKAQIGERWNAACGMAAWEIDPGRNGHIPGQVDAWLQGKRRLGSILVTGAEAVDALKGAVEEAEDAADK
jgi:hypothetical protein